MVDTSNKSFDRGIAIAFAAIVILIGLWTLSKGIWWGTLFNGDQAWLIDVESRPVWNPPPRPAFVDFQKNFQDLPATLPKGWLIGIELKWDFMLITFFLYLLGVSVLFGIVTLIGPAGQHNLGIYVIRSLALSLCGAAAACFVVWLLVGGWGPPSPLLFGPVGLVVGIWMGVSNWSRRTSTSQ